MRTAASFISASASGRAPRSTVDSCGGFFSKVLSYAYMEEVLKNTLHNPPPGRKRLPRCATHRSDARPGGPGYSREKRRNKQMKKMKRLLSATLAGWQATREAWLRYGVIERSAIEMLADLL